MYPDTDDNNEGDDTPPPRKQYPLSPARMSKIPSWVSLGVVIGAVVGWNLKPTPRPTSIELRMPEPPPAKLEAQPTKLTTVEAAFEDWGQFAVWDENNGTQIAYWNPGTQDFTEFYDVRRAGEAIYFRSIPKLTRRIIRHGKEPPSNCPLQFTETEEQYREWQASRVERPAPKAALPPPAAVPVPQVERPSIDLPSPAPGK